MSPTRAYSYPSKLQCTAWLFMTCSCFLGSTAHLLAEPDQPKPFSFQLPLPDAVQSVAHVSQSRETDQLSFFDGFNSYEFNSHSTFRTFNRSLDGGNKSYALIVEEGYFERPYRPNSISGVHPSSAFRRNVELQKRMLHRLNEGKLSAEKYEAFWADRLERVNPDDKHVVFIPVGSVAISSKNETRLEKTSLEAQKLEIQARYAHLESIPAPVEPVGPKVGQGHLIKKAELEVENDSSTEDTNRTLSIEQQKALIQSHYSHLEQ